MIPITSYAQDLHEALLATRVSVDGKEADIDSGIKHVLAMLESVSKKSGKVIVVGNGGSAAIASHMAIDLLNAAKVPAMTLSDVAQLTCIGNDYGYEEVYRRPIMQLAQRGDVIIVISSSGKSQNIVKAAQAGKEKGATVITLTGFKEDNPVRSIGDVNFYIPSQSYGMVELGHQILLHAIIDNVQHHEK